MHKFLSVTPPPLGRPPSVKATSSDANAAYRPRPYYFSEDEAERSWEQEKAERAQSASRSSGATSSSKPKPRQQSLSERGELPNWEAPYDYPVKSTEKEVEETGTIIQSRHVRPSLPVKQDQRPVINERVRPASFYERVRLDDRDYFDGRFVRPEVAYYQFRS